MSNTKQRLDDLKSMLDDTNVTNNIKPAKTRKLTDKQLSFIEHYTSNGNNGTQAAISAGYAPTYATSKASQLLSDPLIKAEVNQRKALIKDKLEINKDWLLDQYMQVINSAQINGTDGEGTVHDRSNWIKALQAISKACGLDEPTKVDITTNGFNINYVIPQPDNEDDEETIEEDND